MRSLKWRLICGMIASMVLLLVCFSTLVYHFMSRSIRSQFDAMLRSSADLMCAAVEWSTDGLEFEFDVQSSEYAENGVSCYYEFRRPDGEILERSPSLKQDESIHFEPGNRPIAFRTWAMNDAARVRGIAVMFHPRTESEQPGAAPVLVLTVARNFEEIAKQLAFLKYLLAAASAAIIALACGVAAIVVKVSLAPLTSVAHQIEDVGEENLGRRVLGERLPAEVALIQNRINSLLERLELSFQRERSLNANLAHELRTPLAGMRSIIDVTLVKERAAGDYREALAELIPIIDDMNQMSETLLLMTKIETGQAVFEPELLRVSPLVDKCWAAMAAKAHSSAIVFENNLNQNILCRSNADGLLVVFSNLLGNAVEYTNKGGRIWVTSQKRKENVEIVFENTGSQLTDEQVRNVFDPYWRADLVRSKTNVHFGLGLALAKRIIKVLGGKMRAETASGLFRVFVLLPC
ncbi:MAG: HAMP domain-containing histidine kinase [Planctomycetaceae bacterium]|nr:HAMP domain-containing histidine kinase [Planctomycetaceae bacterium]